MAVNACCESPYPHVENFANPLKFVDEVYEVLSAPADIPISDWLTMRSLEGWKLIAASGAFHYLARTERAMFEEVGPGRLERREFGHNS